MRPGWFWITTVGLLAAVGVDVRSPAQDVLKAGIVGCDTSHVVAFTKLINAPDAAGDLAGLRIVAAWPGGTDIPASKNRVAGYTEQLRKGGVEIVDSISALLDRVDVVLLESVDGRSHLEQARAILRAKKPVFIDKPMAGSLADVLAIKALAEKEGVPWFSCSSLRFADDFQSLRAGGGKIGRVVGADAWSPCTLEPTHPDLFWYGVHGVEALFTVMGPGCERVTRVRTEGTDVVVGVWKDGRIGTFRGIRQGRRDYGVTAFGTKGVVRTARYAGYGPLVKAMARFFRTRRPPVAAQETVELFAFMEAADESRRRGGIPITIASVLARARHDRATGRVGAGPEVTVRSMIPSRVSGGKLPGVEVALRNATNTDLILNLGLAYANGRDLHPSALRLLLTDAAGTIQKLELRLPPVGGRLDDYLLPLRAGSTHVVRLSLGDFWCPDRPKFPLVLAPGRYRVQVELRSGAPTHVNADTAGLKLMRVWSGAASSSGESAFEVQ